MFGLENWVDGLWWLAAVSAVTFVASLAVVPFLAVRIPADYFSASRRGDTRWGRRHPALRLVVMAAKNLLGLVLVAAGVVMLVLPGQGLLTIFMGLLLMNFPGKYRLERFIVSRGPVLRGINWIRHRWKVEPLDVNQMEDSS
ncbi:MAG: hypothetical protein GXY42_12835 [Desulfovibrionales bacterium]|nr:hypothetical protein [Desulfovibrionales bacterium]